MTPPPLCCTVRGCARPLTRGGRAWACEAGHSYDIARSGYVNLLQPQDRRSLASGDSRGIAAARASLLERGIGRTAIEAVVGRARLFGETGELIAVDLGSGPGDLLGALAAATPITGIGIDISAAAAALASRRFPAHTWVVANADRRLPLQDGSVDLVISANGRRNPAECHRVLSSAGRLLVAVPGADDLVELRQRVQGRRLERDRGEPMLADHERLFSLVDRTDVREVRLLDHAALMDVLHTTYRGVRFADARRGERLDTLEVTFSSSLFVLAPSNPQRVV